MLRISAGCFLKEITDSESEQWKAYHKLMGIYT